MGLVNFRQLTIDEFEKAKAISLICKTKEQPTPEEKLETRIRKRNVIGEKVRKFHFFWIENGKEAILFNGIRQEIGKFENSIKGMGLARDKAVETFLDAKGREDRNGGYKFD